MTRPRPRPAPVLALLLALALALTSGALTMARGQAGPAGYMVLCTGSGPASVAVDASGAPTDPPPVCPDWIAAAVTALVPLPAAALARPVRRGADFPALSGRSEPDAPELPPAARGPPHLC